MYKQQDIIVRSSDALPNFGPHDSSLVEWKRTMTRGILMAFEGVVILISFGQLVPKWNMRYFIHNVKKDVKAKLEESEAKDLKDSILRVKETLRKIEAYKEEDRRQSQSSHTGDNGGTAG